MDKADILNNVTETIKERVELIDYKKELYKISNDGDEFLYIFYEGKSYLIIKPIIRRQITKEGRIRLCSEVTIHRRNDAKWYGGYYKSFLVTVDEFQKWTVDKVTYTVQKFLDKYLPLGNKYSRDIIRQSLDNIKVNIGNIHFDTMSQRYIIEMDIKDYLINNSKKRDDELFLCKYMSLDTYLCILKYKRIRLNSIVSMNDSSEGFFLGDYLCDAYDDVRLKNTNEEYYKSNPTSLRNKKIVEYKNTLIMSLTERIDDALMWRLYGDCGRGVCLCFKVPRNLVHTIIYISETNEKLFMLKKSIEEWKKKGINVKIPSIGDYMMVTKSVQFDYECEYRITKTCDNSKLQITKYGDLISFYHDFSLEELGIVANSLYIGSNLPHRDINYPLLVDLSNRILNIHIINNSEVDKLRV